MKILIKKGFDFMVAYTTDATFQKDVLESNVPVLVDFMADWCQPCKQLAPVLSEVSEQMAGRIKIVKMDIDQNSVVPSNLGIRSIPTLILYKDGKAISTQGSMSKQKMLDWLQNV